MQNFEHIQQARQRIEGRQLGRHAVELSKDGHNKNTLAVRQGIFVEVDFDGIRKVLYVVEPGIDTAKEIAGKVRELDLPSGVMIVRPDHELGMELIGKSVGDKLEARNGKLLVITRISETLEDLSPAE